MSPNEQRLQNVTDLIRKQRYSYSQIEDDYQLLTEYVYDNPQSFDDFKHLLPEVTRQEIQGKREEAFAESEKMAAIEPEKGDPLETVGWTAFKGLRSVPHHIIQGLDAQLASLGDPTAYKETWDPEAQAGLNILAQEVNKTAPGFLEGFEADVLNRIKERDQNLKDYWTDWNLKHPRALAHQKYRNDNPAGWAPWKWDATDIAEIATSGLTEFGSQMAIGFFGGPAASGMYNYTRILGGGITERIAKLEDQGYSPLEAFRTANALSQFSAFGQMIPEMIFPNMLLGKSRFKSLLNKKDTGLLGSLVQKNVAKNLSKEVIEEGTKTGLLSDFISSLRKSKGADILTYAFGEAFTEWGQYIFDKSVDKYGIDKTINLWEEAISDEAAMDFWAGFAGGFGAKGSHLALESLLGADPSKFKNFKFKIPNIVDKDGAADQEALIDKYLAEYTAPDEKTAAEAQGIIEEGKEVKKILTLGGVQLAEDLSERMDKEAERRSDDAIIIDNMMSKGTSNLTLAEIDRLSELIQASELSPEELFEMASNNPSAIVEAGYSPEAVVQEFKEQDFEIPENLEPFVPLPDVPFDPAMMDPTMMDPTLMDPALMDPSQFELPPDPAQMKLQEEQMLKEQGYVLPEEEPVIPTLPEIIEPLTKKELQNKKPDDLRLMLDNAGLSTKGAKNALVARIINAPIELQDKMKEVEIEPKGIKELKEFAKKIVGAKSVKLIGSTARKGKGKDVDILYDIGTLNIPEYIEESGPYETAVWFVENNPVKNYDPTHDNIFKFKDQRGDIRYFHIDPKNITSPAKEMGHKKVIDSIEADIASGVAIELKTEEEVPKGEQTTIFDPETRESRLVRTHPVLEDKVSENYANYMSAIHKKMGDSASFFINNGSLVLPKTFTFTFNKKKYTLEKLTTVPFMGPNRRRINPDIGLYKLIDYNGNIVEKVFPLTQEAKQAIIEHNDRQIERNRKTTEWLEFMLGKGKVKGKLQVIGKEYYPNKSSNLALQKSMSFQGIPYVPEEIKYMMNQIELEDTLGFSKNKRQNRNRARFLTHLRESLESAREVYQGKDFDKKLDTVIRFFEYLPKHVFTHLVTYLEEFNGYTYGKAIFGPNFKLGYVAPWRGIVEKIYDAYGLDKGKIDLIFSDIAAREGWFEAYSPVRKEHYIKREKAVIHHFIQHHKDKFKEDNDVLFAIEKAKAEVNNEIEEALTKRLKDKLGIENGLKFLPIVLMTFGKSKNYISDVMFESPIHEFVHYIEFLAGDTKDWKEIQGLINKLIFHPDFDPFIAEIEEQHEDLISESASPLKLLKAEVLSHIMQRVIYDEIGLADKYTASKTDHMIDNILKEGKNKGLYEKIKRLIWKVINWISKTFRGKPFANIDSVYDNIVDLREAIYKIIHKKEIFEKDPDAGVQYYSKAYYSRLAKDKTDIFRIYDQMWDLTTGKLQGRFFKGKQLDADKFLNEVSNMLDENKLGEFKKILYEWAEERSRQKKINWNNFQREKKPEIEEISWMSGYDSESLAWQLWDEVIYLLGNPSFRDLHIRKSGDVLNYLPVYTLGITLRDVEFKKLVDTAKNMNDGEFKKWLSGPQEMITSYSARNMTAEQKELMHIFYLRMRQSIVTNMPLLSGFNKNLIEKIPNNQRSNIQLQKIVSTDYHTKERSVRFTLLPITATTPKWQGTHHIPQSRPTTTTPTIAELNNPRIADNIVWLSDSEFYSGYPITDQRYGYGGKVSSLKPSYNFLVKEDLIKIDNSQKDFILVSVRGDSRRAIFAKIKPEHREAAKDITYWKKQKEMGFITAPQLEVKKKDIKTQDEQFLASEIAFFEVMNDLLPRFATWKVNVSELVRRIKIPLTPIVRVEGLSEQKYLRVDPKTTRIKIGDKIYDMMQDIPDVGMQNVFDGAMWSGADYFIELHDKGGVKKDTAVAKTVWYYVNEKKEMIAAKHAEFNTLYKKGMQWIDGMGDIIARVDSKGIIRLANNNIVQHIGTKDEIKISTKAYDKLNVPIDIPGEAIGIVQWTGKRKEFSKFLKQFFNFVPGDSVFAKDFIKYHINGTIKNRLLRYKKSLQTKEGVQTFVNQFIKQYPELISNSYLTLVNKGAGRHPVVQSPLFGYSGKNMQGQEIVKYKGLVVDKLIHNMINLSGFKGTIAVFEPNTDMDLGELEFNLSFSNTGFLRKQFRDMFPTKRFTVHNVNRWLKNFNIFMLVGRSPVAHRAGVLYMRLRKVLEGGDIVQFNPITVKRYFDGDQDYDKAYIIQLPSELESSATKYFNSKEFTDSMKGNPLDQFISKKKFDIMVRDSRHTVTEAMNFGTNAIGQIANVQTIYGILQDVVKSFTIDRIKFKVRDPKLAIDAAEMRKGYKKELEVVLRMYLQSAVDNAKYLLLNHWNWTRDSMIEKLFVSEDGVPLSEYKTAAHILKKTLWKKLEGAIEILNAGEFDTNLDFETLTLKSEAYNQFVQDRMSPDYVLSDEISVEFKDTENINETLALVPYNVFIKNTSQEQLISTVFGEDPNKMNVFQYYEAAQLDAHLYAVEIADAKVMKDIENKLEKYKRKFKVDSLEELLAKVHNSAKRYALGGGKDPKIYKFKTHSFTVAGGGRSVNKGLLNRILNANNTVSGRPVFPHYWDTNKAFVEIRKEYNETFKELSNLTRQLATIMYLKALTGVVDAGGNMRLELIPMPIESMNTEALLDPMTMQAYFNAHDARLDAANTLSTKLKELKCV